MLTNPLCEKISALLDEKVLEMLPLAGGSINEVYRLVTAGNSYVIKLNTRNAFPGMFESELQGLKLLAGTKTIGIPEGIRCGAILNYDYILMQHLEAGRKIKTFHETFGRSLAELHQNKSNLFGLDHHNYIGSLPQQNTQMKEGDLFFIHHRLEPLARTAYQKQLMPEEVYKEFQQLYPKLESMLPDEKPSLIHGDLWSGNSVTGPDGKAWLIDPAVYYGYRESDLAMSRLFGGFDETFYAAYHEAFPLGPGWEERVGLFNLYPLLVHLNLFGRGYLTQILSALRMLK